MWICQDPDVALSAWTGMWVRRFAPSDAKSSKGRCAQHFRPEASMYFATFTHWRDMITGLASRRSGVHSFYGPSRMTTMAHDFAHAYANVKSAVKGLVATDPLRVSLNLASAQFSLISDDDFDKAPYLRAEFRSLRARLRRSPDARVTKNVRYLDNTDSTGMVLLAQDLLDFSNKMDTIEYDGLHVSDANSVGIPRLIHDPGPDNWDEDPSLD